MQKVRFLQTYGSFQKDSCRVILGEDDTYYYIQTSLHSLEKTRFHKKSNGLIFQVIERS